MEQDLKDLDEKELFDMLTAEKEISEKAFSVFYDRYSARVWAYCLRFIGDKDIAKDIYQDTFMKFYRSAGKGYSMANVGGFLMRIARNSCLNYKAKEKQTVEYSENLHTIVDNNEDRQELLNLIRVVMKKLPEEYREAFILREYKCMSYKEIAEIAGISIDNVKVRIFRAKQKIRDLLAIHIKEMADK